MHGVGSTREGPARRLRIGIDAHAIGERKTGNERFIRNVIPALRDGSNHELVLYFTRPEAAAAWPARPGQSVRLLRPAHPVARIPFVLPWMAARDRLDVLLVQYAGPPVAPCPVVTVVHDVAFALYPEFFSRAERVWMNRAIPLTMRRAAHVLTVSEFSRQEILRVYGLPPERVTVAHDGVDRALVAAAAGEAGVEGRYFLAVGNLQPRKNLATLVGAYARLIDSRPDVAERLVIVGQEWFRSEELFRRTDGLRRAGRIVFTGYIEDERLAPLLAGATAFAYPSVYEGFGLPPLEAMAVGTPAVVSDIPVMREVVGDAAVLVPPTDEAAWARALERLATDPAERRRLAEAGPGRAASFTWAACAAAILPVLERAARPPRG